MQVAQAHFITAYFAAYWGIVCPGRTIKSLFYLIRKLLRHMNNRTVFQYISHRLIFQFYETSCSYLWVRFTEPVLDLNRKLLMLLGRCAQALERPEFPSTLNDTILFSLPLVPLACVWLTEIPTSFVTKLYFCLILATFSFKNLCICPTEIWVSWKKKNEFHFSNFISIQFSGFSESGSLWYRSWRCVWSAGWRNSWAVCSSGGFVLWLRLWRVFHKLPVLILNT